MHITVSITLPALINTILCTNIMIIAYIIVINSKFLLRYINLSTVILGFLIILLRFLFPYEFVFAKEIPDTMILPHIRNILDSQIMNSKVTLLGCIIFVWLTISTVYFIKLVSDYFKTRNSLLKFDIIDDVEIKELLSCINGKYKKESDILLVTSPIISTPFIFGIHNPIIALPQISISKKELSFIFEHELCHYYKKHLQIKILLEVVTAIYFWNPFIYILKKQIDKVLELCIDAKVTEELSEIEKIEYLECLVRIAKIQQTSMLIQNCTIAFSPTSSLKLTKRVKMLLDSPNHVNYPLFNKLFLSFTIVLIAVTYLFVYEPYSIRKDYSENTFTINKDNAYYVLNKEHTYDLYVNSKYTSTVTVIFDSTLPVKEE